MATSIDYIKVVTDNNDKAREAFGEGRLKEAFSFLRKSISMFEAFDDPRLKIRTYLELGNIYGAYESEVMAVDSYLAALDIADGVEDLFSIAAVYTAIGNRYLHIGNDKGAIDYLQKAEVALDNSICRIEPDYYSLSTLVYLYITIAYVNLRSIDNARFYLDKCRKNNERLSAHDFDNDILMFECRIDLLTRKTKLVKENIDQIIDFVFTDIESPRFSYKLRELVTLLMGIRDYERMDFVLRKIDAIAEDADIAGLELNSAKWKCDYYKAVRDTEAHHLASLEYMNLLEKQQEVSNRQKADLLDIRMGFHDISGALEQQDDVIYTDELTGFGNATTFEDDYNRICEKCEMDDTLMAIGMINIDEFKTANNTYGHLNGDMWLRRIAKTISDNLEDGESIYRLKGDEFMLIAENTSEERLEELAQNIKSAIAELKIQNINSPISRYITVSQGYAYMIPNLSIGYEQFVSYAFGAMSEVKISGKNGYKVSEAGENDYKLFYQQYNRNLRLEKKLETDLYSAETLEDWKERLDNRSRITDLLFTKNERLLDKYIRPYFDSDKKMDDVTAITVAEEIWKMFKSGIKDSLVVLQMAELLEDFFADKDYYYEEHIYTLVILSSAYRGMAADEYRDRCEIYYDKLKSYRDKLGDITKRTLRQEICDACLSSAIYKAGKAETDLGTSLEMLDAELNFFKDGGVKDYLHMSDDEARSYIDSFFISIISAGLDKCFEVDADNEHYRHVYEILDELYNRYLEEAGDEYQLDGRLYSIYYKAKYLLGELDIEETFDAHRRYYESHLEHFDDEIDVNNIDKETSRFNLMIYFVPAMVRFFKGTVDHDSAIEAAKFTDVINKYSDYIGKLSKLETAPHISGVLYDSFLELFNFIDKEEEAVDVIIEFIVSRDIDISLKANYIYAVSQKMLDYIYEDKPEILIGSLGTETLYDVVEDRAAISNYLGNAARLLDCGKALINVISTVKTRQLTAKEQDTLDRHTELSKKLFSKSEVLKSYLPMIMGLSKNFDDSGYPDDYSYLDNPNPILLNILQIAYAISEKSSFLKGKTDATLMGILRELENTGRYNKEIIDIYFNDNFVKENLDKEQYIAMDYVTASLFERING